jgi:hypothetical protein
MTEQSLFEQAQQEFAERQSALIQSGGDEDQDKKATLAEKFVLFVQERAELFHDENREAYATVNATGHTYKAGSSAFDDWLCASLMNESGIVAREQPRREAIQTLRGIARHRGEELAVWLRCGVASDGAYVVDLCQPDNSNAVVVHPGNWDLVAVPPVRFVRNPDSLPLPVPTKGGDISPLWRVANIPADLRSLVLAWLLESFRPDTPFPVLELIGEEGTAKSTTQNALRNLIDPNRVNLRAAPRNREDLCTSAAVNWLVSYENLSHLNPDLQDALCTVATGGGFATRKLYTTGEETTLKFKRPVILNGISASRDPAGFAWPRCVVGVAAHCHASGRQRNASHLQNQSCANAGRRVRSAGLNAGRTAEHPYRPDQQAAHGGLLPVGHGDDKGAGVRSPSVLRQICRHAP